MLQSRTRSCAKGSPEHHGYGDLAPVGIAHFGRMVDELGRMIGGWIQADKAKTITPMAGNKGEAS